MSIQQAVSPSAYVSLIKGRTNWTVIHHFFNDTDTLFWLRPVQYYLCSTKTGIADKSVNTVAKGKAPVHNRFNIFFINLMLISFWVKNRRSFLNALRWKGILFSKSPSNSIFNCLCYHTPHSFPQSFSWFQSTLPRGERHWKDVHTDAEIQNFNPRSHEGSDHRECLCDIPYKNFNPRSHEGSDLCFGKNLHLLWNFNPRSHEGSDCNID